MQSSRSRALAVVAVAALAMSSVALAAGGLSGTYATTIKALPRLKGKWALILARRHVHGRGERAARRSGQVLVDRDDDHVRSPERGSGTTEPARMPGRSPERP